MHKLPGTWPPPPPTAGRKALKSDPPPSTTTALWQVSAAAYGRTGAPPRRAAIPSPSLLLQHHRLRMATRIKATAYKETAQWRCTNNGRARECSGVQWSFQQLPLEPATMWGGLTSALDLSTPFSGISLSWDRGASVPDNESELLTVNGERRAVAGGAQGTGGAHSNYLSANSSLW